jgi:predicted DNA-binding protein
MKKDRENKIATIAVRLTEGTRDKLEIMSHENYRSTSQEVRKLIEDALEKHEWRQ